MSVIKWRDAYNTGVEQFDMEHHRIVELIDQVYVAIRDKSGRGVIEKACSDALAYTEYHFSNEEQAMKAANFPELEEHIAEHARMKQDVLEIQSHIDNNLAAGAQEFYRFLRDWLINHIQECDHKYSPYLKDGVKPNDPAGRGPS